MIVEVNVIGCSWSLFLFSKGKGAELRKYAVAEPALVKEID
jgi:hypothetical protein